MELYFQIPLEPVGKKNSQQILKGKGGRPFIAQSQRYKDYEKNCLQFMPFLPEHIDFPINLQCIFYKGSKRRVDTVNLLEAIQDILVLGGILADDNRDIVASTEGTRTLYDKAFPRTEITITDYEGEYEQWKAKDTKS